MADLRHVRELFQTLDCSEKRNGQRRRRRQQQQQRQGSSYAQDALQTTIHKVVWNLNNQDKSNNGEMGDYLMMERLGQFLSHCNIMQLELVLAKQTLPFSNTHLALLQQVVSHPTLTSLAVLGECLEGSLSVQAIFKTICEGIRQRRTSTLQSITWAPFAVDAEQQQTTYSRQATKTKSSFGLLVQALVAIQWSGDLQLSARMDTRAWKDLMLLLTHPLVQVQHLDLDVSDNSCAANLNSLVQSTSLQSLLLHGTAVLECWNLLPDHLTQVLWRNRLLAHIGQQQPPRTRGEMAWLVTQLVTLDAGMEIVATPLYTLLRNHYLRPSHHG